MIRLELRRVTTSIECTMGVLLDHSTGLPIVLTLENPWLENQKEISCIPKGIYMCMPYSSEKYSEVYEVKDVPSRSAILFHVGNFEAQTKGCILVGTTFGELNHKPAVLSSKSGMNILRNYVGDNNFELIVT